jgi:hypothetical protein
MAKLIITEQNRDKIYEVLDLELTIGAGPGVELHLRDPHVEPRHLLMRAGETGFHIVDLETKAGTFVNGRAVNEHVLSNGDVIEVGSTKLTYIGPGPERPMRPSAAPPVPLRPSRDWRRRGTLGDQLGPVGRTLVVIAIFAGAIIVGTWAISESTASHESFRERLRDATAAIEHPGPRGFEAAAETLETARRVASTATHRAEVDALEKRLAAAREAAAERDRRERSAAAWAHIERVARADPGDAARIRDLGVRYLDDLGAHALPEEAGVRALLAGLPRLPVRQRAIVSRAFVEAESSLERGEYRRAALAIERADLLVRSLYSEEFERLMQDIRRESLAAAASRKAAVRDALRDGDAPRARSLAAATLEQLVWSTLDESLAELPQGAGESAAAERDARELLRALLAERRRPSK